MLSKVSSFLVFYLFLFQNIICQTENYLIEKSPFSTDKYDEFSPVYYKNGIVFCSNQSLALPFNYSTGDNKSFFKIHFIDTAALKNKAEFLSDDLNSNFNDGPVSFNRTGDTIYFSRNIIGNARPWKASDPRNTLGIFFAVRSGNKWENITELRFNSDSYNVTTPWLTPDGKRLYFASDKPGGYGGADLYYCEWKNNYWNNPVNLGNIINTEGNEAYPFVNAAGDLFFSSDGHKGMGGKDIYYSIFMDSVWIKPVMVNPPINSEYDDFAFIADENISEGFFTSKRSASMDIYNFKTLIPQLFYCGEQKKDLFCFSFQDDLTIDIDPVNLQFTWDFGDGKTKAGYIVDHCFPGPGKYQVKQNIIEKKTGRIVFNKVTYNLELKETVQGYIKVPDNIPPGMEVVIDGSESHLPGYEISNYNWDFGNGIYKTGKSVSYAFKENGEHVIHLGIQAREISTGINRNICVSKKIIIGERKTAMGSGNPETEKTVQTLPGVNDYYNAMISYRYSAADALAEKAIFQSEIISSGTSIKKDDNVFKKLDPKFSVKEIYLEDEKIFSYVIDEGMSFMDVYFSLREIMPSSFKNARIKTYIPANQAERELWNIKRLYGTSADLFFDRDDFRVKNGEYPVLDQIIILMKKNTSVKIEIAGHTDNSQPVEATNQKLSQSRAQSILNYMVEKGISRTRLKATGYGSARPVAPNYSEADRMKNRRIDFIFLND